MKNLVRSSLNEGFGWHDQVENVLGQQGYNATEIEFMMNELPNLVDMTRHVPNPNTFAGELADYCMKKLQD